MSKSGTVAVILAGGEGRRLGVLTKSNSKPLVLFGGRFKIIDFPISNCINSGVNKIGILAQKQICDFNECKNAVKNANLAKKKVDVQILTPSDTSKGCYMGTADAVYQNISYIDALAPENILILSGDHIYKMDYTKMMEFHAANDSHATISAITVSWKEANRYGIINTNSNGSISGFEEKPQNPKSNYVSMGIYIFKWKVLREYLIMDNFNENSAHDFGKNVIPAMLKGNCKMWAYEFKGYWKDVGTIQSYWDANMDLLGSNRSFDPFLSDWEVFASGTPKKAAYIHSNKNISNSIINEECKILGKVRNSIIFPDVYVGENANIIDSVILPGSQIGKKSTIEKSIIGNNVVVGNNVRIGANSFSENESIVLSSDISVVGRGTEIVDYSYIGRNVMIDEEVFYNQHKFGTGKEYILYQTT